MIKKRGQFLPLNKNFFGKFYRVAPQKIDLFDFLIVAPYSSPKNLPKKKQKSRGHNAKKYEHS